MRTMALTRKRECTEQAPTPAEATINPAGGHPHPFSPNGDGLGFAVELQAAASASIPVLLLLGRPLYVARGVVAVIIDAIERMAGRRAWAHSPKELLERREQKMDSTPPISAVVTPCRVVAPAAGSGIRRVFGCVRGSMRSRLSAQASARATVAARQGIFQGRCGCPATAQDEPHGRTVRRVSGVSLDGQQAKYLAGQVAKHGAGWVGVVNGAIIFTGHIVSLIDDVARPFRERTRMAFSIIHQGGKNA